MQYLWFPTAITIYDCKELIEIMIIHSLIFLDARRPPLLDPRPSTLDPRRNT
jgi:hypothetical protein